MKTRFSVKAGLYATATLVLLVFAPAARAQETATDGRTQQMVWVDRAGKVLGKIGDPQAIITDIALSPDQKMAAVRGRNIRDGNDDIWLYDLERHVKTQLTYHPAHERHACFSPDGRQVVYFSYRNGPANFYLANDQGRDQPFLLLANETYAPTWSSDGKYILYHLHDLQDKKYNNRDLWYVDVKERKPIPFTATPTFKEAMARFSPDGRYVAYMSDESGAWEAYVKTFPDGKQTARISTKGAVWPHWNGKGDEIYFWEGNTLMVVSVVTTPTFKIGAPQKLFTGEQTGMGPEPATGFNTLYEVAPDGQRFIVVQNSLKRRE
ncbi:MAG: PD40 domain-containing protein [candidate division Zixibacteria bacterium]|nr:PD40 domain-containing protein [candidate division Zixibacteria bacterium]